MIMTQKRPDRFRPLYGSANGGRLQLGYLNHDASERRAGAALSNPEGPYRLKIDMSDFAKERGHE